MEYPDILLTDKWKFHFTSSLAFLEGKSKRKMPETWEAWQTEAKDLQKKLEEYNYLLKDQEGAPGWKGNLVKYATIARAKILLHEVDTYTRIIGKHHKKGSYQEALPELKKEAERIIPLNFKKAQRLNLKQWRKQYGREFNRVAQLLGEATAYAKITQNGKAAGEICCLAEASINKQEQLENYNGIIENLSVPFSPSEA